MQFLVDWLDGANNASAEERATLCDLRVLVGGVNSCWHQDELEASSYDAVTVPAVYFAEGIATDWWTIFGGRDQKHSILPYRTGFILPCLSFSCDGPTFEISGEQMYCDNPGVRFWQAGGEVVQRVEAEDNLTRFIEDTIERLFSAGIRESEVALQWGRVSASRQDTDEGAFCEAAGALGVNPYSMEASDVDFILQAGGVLSGGSLAEFLAGVSTLDRSQRSITLNAVTNMERCLDDSSRLPGLKHAVREVHDALRERRAGEGAWAPGYRSAGAFRNVNGNRW